MSFTHSFQGSIQLYIQVNDTDTFPARSQQRVADIYVNKALDPGSISSTTPYRNGTVTIYLSFQICDQCVPRTGCCKLFNNLELHLVTLIITIVHTTHSSSRRLLQCAR